MMMIIEVESENLIGTLAKVYSMGGSCRYMIGFCAGCRSTYAFVQSKIGHGAI